VGGTDRFPALPDAPRQLVEALAAVADQGTTLAVHDVSHGGLAVTLAEMVGAAGADVTLAGDATAAELLFSEAPGRAVVETTDTDAVSRAFDGVAPVTEVGTTTDDGRLDLTVGGETLTATADEIAAWRDVVRDGME
jgi:phosphoribosylformylglycinamidine synthase